MKPSEYRTKLVEKMKEKVIKLYKEGKGSRHIAALLELEDDFKRSHEWVRTVIRDFDFKK